MRSEEIVYLSIVFRGPNASLGYVIKNSFSAEM